jgi:hypothetical protein
MTRELSAALGAVELPASFQHPFYKRDPDALRVFKLVTLESDKRQPIKISIEAAREYRQMFSATFPADELAAARRTVDHSAPDYVVGMPDVRRVSPRLRDFLEMMTAAKSCILRPEPGGGE